MNIENIRLQDAMTRDSDCLIRVWEILGLHIEVDEFPKKLPENATVDRTFVMKGRGEHFRVGVWYIIEDDLDKEDVGEYALPITFSTLDEIQKKFPNLFELEGDLMFIR